jgi:putative Mg2+ transporter-C (MgtC) family protein
MTVIPGDIAKLLMAILVGGLIGAEREYRDRAAGFRTIILICLGSTLYTIFSLKLGGTQDPVRVAAAIVSGVGFLGAGTILRGPGRVVGLTTASTIWLAAALGIGIGGGYYLLSAVSAGLAWVVLAVFPRIEEWIDSVRDTRTYQITCTASLKMHEEMEDLIRSCGLRAKRRGRTKSGEQMVCAWDVSGSPESHSRFVEHLFEHPDVKDFHS